MDEYEYWQERCAQDDVDNTAMPTPQPVPPPGADDVHVIALRGKMLRASFFGVSDGDEYILTTHGRERALLRDDT